MANGELNIRQERFCILYAQTGNAKQAYIDAGYSAKGAEPSAVTLLSNPNVFSRVQAEKQKINDRLDSKLMEMLEKQRRQFIIDSDLAQDALRDVILHAASNSPARVQAAIGILDRAGHNPMLQIEANVTNHDPISEIPEDKRESAILEAAIATGKVARISGTSR
jgi:hypothetical protein